MVRDSAWELLALHIGKFKAHNDILVDFGTRFLLSRDKDGSIFLKRKAKIDFLPNSISGIDNQRFYNHVIVGRNGTGKSTILDLLAIMIEGNIHSIKNKLRNDLESSLFVIKEDSNSIEIRRILWRLKDGIGSEEITFWKGETFSEDSIKLTFESDGSNEIPRLAGVYINNTPSDPEYISSIPQYNPISSDDSEGMEDTGGNEPSKKNVELQKHSGGDSDGSKKQFSYFGVMENNAYWPDRDERRLNLFSLLVFKSFPGKVGALFKSIGLQFEPMRLRMEINVPEKKSVMKTAVNAICGNKELLSARENTTKPLYVLSKLQKAIEEHRDRMSAIGGQIRECVRSNGMGAVEIKKGLTEIYEKLPRKAGKRKALGNLGIREFLEIVQKDGENQLIKLAREISGYLKESYEEEPTIDLFIELIRKSDDPEAFFRVFFKGWYLYGLNTNVENLFLGRNGRESGIKKILSFLDTKERQSEYEFDMTDFRASFEDDEIYFDLFLSNFFRITVLNNDGLSIHDMSSGEYQFFGILNKFIYYVQREVFGDSSPKTFVFVFDEPDAYLHPEWVRRFAYVLSEAMKLFGDFRREKLIFQCIITTHSPILLSDIPLAYVNALKKDKEEGIIKADIGEETFLGNLYSLFAHPFFVDSFIGEYATNTYRLAAGLLTNEEIEGIKKVVAELKDKEVRELLGKFLNSRSGEPRTGIEKIDIVCRKKLTSESFQGAIGDTLIQKQFEMDEVNCHMTNIRTIENLILERLSLPHVSS